MDKLGLFGVVFKVFGWVGLGILWGFYEVRIYVFRVFLWRNLVIEVFLFLELVWFLRFKVKVYFFMF